MNILVFFAHPDDETMLCGGLLALLSQDGHDVHYLSCTRGEGGERGEPPLCEQSELGLLRENELRCAFYALGGKSLTFLDYVDPLVGSNNQLFAFTEDRNSLAALLNEQINKNKIEILITHGSNGEYGHPGHLLVYETARQVVHEVFPDLIWYTVQAYYENSPKPHILNKNNPADWVVDVSSVLDEKIKAANCHRTQHALFIRRKSVELDRKVNVAEIIPTEESYHVANGKTDILGNLAILKANMNHPDWFL